MEGIHVKLASKVEKVTSHFKIVIALKVFKLGWDSLCYLDTDYLDYQNEIVKLSIYTFALSSYYTLTDLPLCSLYNHGESSLGTVTVPVFGWASVWLVWIWSNK